MMKEKVRYDKISKHSVCGDVCCTVQGGCTYGDDNQVKATEQYSTLVCVCGLIWFQSFSPSYLDVNFHSVTQSVS